MPTVISVAIRNPSKRNDGDKFQKPIKDFKWC